MILYPQSEFPLLKEYSKHFDITPNAIFAYDHKIYSNTNLPEHLIVHEQTHHKQQDEYGLKNWVEKYLNDKHFRLLMEIDAYQTQLKSIKDGNIRVKVAIESAKNLSSSLYGNIIEHKEALRLLMKK